MEWQPMQIDSAIEETVRGYRPVEQLVPAHWIEGDVRANGIRQHYYRTGGKRKPPLVLLHGLNEYGLAWLRLALELEADYDVVMLDARGHGRSEGIESGFSTEILAADAAAAMRALKLGRVPVIGFSMGGGTALCLAVDYADQVSAMVYEGFLDTANMGNMNAGFKSEGYRNWLRQWLAWLEKMKTLPHPERAVATLPQVAMVMGGGVWPEVEYMPVVEGYALFDMALARNGQQLMAETASATGSVWDVIGRVTQPGLILEHAFEWAQPGAVPEVTEMPSPRPNVRRLHFAGTGHMIRRMAWEVYLGVVRAFLAEV